MLPINCVHVCVCTSVGKHVYVHMHAHTRVHTESYIGKDTHTAMHACYYTNASIIIQVTNVFNLL